MGRDDRTGSAGPTWPSADAPSLSVTDRRRFLRSVMATTGVVWAAPVITNLGVPAYAQASPPPEADVLPRDLAGPEVAGVSLAQPEGLANTGGPGLAGIVAAGAGAIAAGTTALRVSKRRGAGDTEEAEGHEAP
jgi:hypothetical protein